VHALGDLGRRALAYLLHAPVRGLAAV
jgi:hypothetical protein